MVPSFCKVDHRRVGDSNPLAYTSPLDGLRNRWTAKIRATLRISSRSYPKYTGNSISVNVKRWLLWNYLDSSGTFHGIDCNCLERSRQLLQIRPSARACFLRLSAAATAFAVNGLWLSLSGQRSLTRLKISPSVRCWPSGSTSSASRSISSSRCLNLAGLVPLDGTRGVRELPGLDKWQERLF
jgi:hypothetical protein